MKNTTILVVVITVFIITWLVLGLIGYSINDLTYKATLSHTAMIIFMVVFGWIPAAIVGDDLDKSL